MWLLFWGENKELRFYREESCTVFWRTDLRQTWPVGQKGLVTQAMEDVFKREDIQWLGVIGPSIAMKFCTLTHKNMMCAYLCSHWIRDQDWWNGDVRRLSCNCGELINLLGVDGPEFLGEEVDWMNCQSDAAIPSGRRITGEWKLWKAGEYKWLNAVIQKPGCENKHLRFEIRISTRGRFRLYVRRGTIRGKPLLAM